MSDTIYRDAIHTFGALDQMNQCIEECAELITALRHWSRKRATVADVASEIADVAIMVSQMREFFGPALVDECMEAKKERLRKRIESNGQGCRAEGPSVTRNARERV